MEPEKSHIYSNIYKKVMLFPAGIFVTIFLFFFHGIYFHVFDMKSAEVPPIHDHIRMVLVGMMLFLIYLMSRYIKTHSAELEEYSQWQKKQEQLKKQLKNQLRIDEPNKEEMQNEKNSAMIIHSRVKLPSLITYMIVHLLMISFFLIPLFSMHGTGLIILASLQIALVRIFCVYINAMRLIKKNGIKTLMMEEERLILYNYKKKEISSRYSDIKSIRLASRGIFSVFPIGIVFENGKEYRIDIEEFEKFLSSIKSHNKSIYFSPELRNFKPSKFLFGGREAAFSDSFNILL